MTFTARRNATAAPAPQGAATKVKGGAPANPQAAFAATTPQAAVAAGGEPKRLLPVERETVHDRVYAELRRALICGLFQPGQVLTIRGLAEALDTSTMPIREALGRLISEQALEALPNRSVRVPPLSRARLDDLLKARILIEGEAVALAASRLTDADFDGIHGTLAEWDALRAPGNADFDREAALNQEFHFRIYRACGSAVLLPMVESLWLQSGPCARHAAYRFARDASGDAAPDVAHFHRLIVAALEKRDAEAARAALVADISRPFLYLRDRIETENDTGTAS